MELRCWRLLTGQLTKWILRSYFRSFSGKIQSQDPYKCLGVAPSASAKEIKAAFYKKSKELHPDWNSSPTANQDFGKVAEAYALLSDGEKRKDFDKKREAPDNSEFDVEEWIQQAKAEERQRASSYGTDSNRFTQYGHHNFHKRRSEDFKSWAASRETNGQSEPSFKTDWRKIFQILDWCLYVYIIIIVFYCIVKWILDTEKRPNKRLSTSAPENQMDNRNLAVKQSGRTSGEDT